MKRLTVIQEGAPAPTKPVSYEKQTQAYSTWGGKLLQHTDVLHSIQAKKEFKPITIQLAPTEACFTGDTEVSLLDGTVRTLKDLAESMTEPFWVYSYDVELKQVVPGKARRSRLTGKNRGILKLTLDNGKEIKCTEDHEFLLRNGTYMRANELVVGESLMPLYRRLSTVEDDNQSVGYEMFLEPEQSAWQFTHRRVAERTLIRSAMSNSGELVFCEKTPDMTVRHHLDFNKLNNTPENLVWMSFLDHRHYHQELNAVMVEKGTHPFQIYTKTERHRTASSERMKTLNERMKLGEVTPNYRTKMELDQLRLLANESLRQLAEKGLHPSQLRVKNGAHHFQTEAVKLKTKSRTQDLLRSGEHPFQSEKNRSIVSRRQSNSIANGTHYFCSEEHRKRSAERMKIVRQYQSYLKSNRLTKEEFTFASWKAMAEIPNNHKVVKIESCGISDVYCLEVEQYHNFALEAGVFVSNCDSNCPFCSVAWRPVDKKIPWDTLEKGLREFRELGAKSVEITGGGNPLLYKDGSRNINDVIELAHSLGYEIGVITNSEKLSRHIKPENASKLSWIRISLIKLDEGKNPEDYDFSGFPMEKLGFSYIIYEGTTKKSIESIARLVELNPEIKFVRIASDCLTEQSLTIKGDWGDIVQAMDTHKKFFIKEIGETFHPYEGGCWVGMVRPYWVWDGVYMCTSHVLKHRGYHDTWKLCKGDEIKEAWGKMNQRFQAGQNPYDIDIQKECWHCYYYRNNELLSYVVTDLPDKNFA